MGAIIIKVPGDFPDGGSWAGAAGWSLDIVGSQLRGPGGGHPIGMAIIQPKGCEATSYPGQSPKIPPTLKGLERQHD